MYSLNLDELLSYAPSARTLAMVTLPVLCLYTTTKIARLMDGYIHMKDDDRALALDRLDPIGDVEGYDNVPLPAGEIPKLAKRIAESARIALKPTEYTLDQVIQVREWSIRTMKLMHVRTVDINYIIPFVERLAFLETSGEKDARDMEMSRTFQKRQEETYKTFWSYELPSWRYPFGTFKSERYLRVK